MKGTNRQSQIGDQVITVHYLSPYHSIMDVSGITTKRLVRLGLLFSRDTNAVGRRTSFQARYGTHKRGILTNA